MEGDEDAQHGEVTCPSMGIWRQVRFEKTSLMVAAWHWARRMSLQGSGLTWAISQRNEAGEIMGGRLHVQGARLVSIIERSFTNMVRKIKRPVLDWN